MRISYLKGLYSVPVLVCGPGTTLEADIESVKGDKVLISINHHLYYRNINAQYTAFLDDPSRAPVLNTTPFERITPWFRYADIWPDVVYNDMGFSAGFALWVACYISTGRVVVCGCDLYGDESKIKVWAEAANECVNPSRIYATSGPLTKLFK